MGEVQFMTVREAAAYLRLATITIYRLAERSDLPGHKAGGKYLFFREEVERWIRERR